MIEARPSPPTPARRHPPGAAPEVNDRARTAAQRFTLGNLVVDLERYEAWVDGARISLTYVEFELLTLLVRRAGVVVPRQELAAAMWGDPDNDRRLNVQVCRLRKKLEGSRPWRVRTVRRRGYALASDSPPRPGD